MKYKKRSLVSLFLSLAMVFGLVPAGMAAWTDGSQGNLTVTPGETFTLSAGSDGGFMQVEKVIWSSSNSSYISVDRDDGTVTISRLATDGTSAIISAYVYYFGYDSAPSDYRDEFVQHWYWTVTVEDDDTSSDYSGMVSLDPSVLTLKPGESDVVELVPVAGYELSNIRWSSDRSNPYVTVVDNDEYATISVDEDIPYTYATADITVTMKIYADDDRSHRYPETATLNCLVVVEGDFTQFYLSSDELEIHEGEFGTLSVNSYNSVLDDRLENTEWYSDDADVVTVESYYDFDSSNNHATGSTIFVNAVKEGTATVYAELTVGTTEYLASCEVTVIGKRVSDVYYTIGVGENLSLDVESFEEFWSDNVSTTGRLEYVVFGTGSGNVGKLAYYKNNNRTPSSLGSARFYTNPRSTQYGIDEVFFSASTNSRYTTGTLTVPFTAYGTTSSSNKATTSQTGTVHISVIYDDVDPISYELTGTSIVLDSEDFISVYKDAMTSSSSRPTVYIQFLETPEFGDLRYNNSTNNNYTNGTLLTDSNIVTTRFSSRTTGNYQIDNVTYIPNNYAIADTVRYAAYSSATSDSMLYVGEITFHAGEAPVINYYTTAGNAISFSANDFYISELGYASYIKFNTPTYGTFYKNYGTSSATKVTSYDTFTVGSTTTSYMTSLDALTYIPHSNYTGVVEIPFTASNIMGSDTYGKVRIYITKPFTDITSNYAWALDYINRLSAQSIVKGNGDGTFAPGANLKYGEALKLIMEAAGYSETNATTGHWASNYLTRAYREGFITTIPATSSEISTLLNSNVSRNTVAELAAKALKLNPTYSIKAGIVGPSDSTSGYVYALYNAGILNGVNVGGANYYYGANTITRAEICKIICLVNDYSISN